MSKYRKKPVVIEAVQWNPGPKDVRFTFPDGTEFRVRRPSHPAAYSRELEIPTLEGVMKASPGDWIIKGVQGEYYPCKPDIFEATYDCISVDVATYGEPDAPDRYSILQAENAELRAVVDAVEELVETPGECLQIHNKTDCINAGPFAVSSPLRYFGYHDGQTIGKALQSALAAKRAAEGGE